MFRMLIAAGIIFGVVLLWAWIQHKAEVDNRTQDSSSCASCGAKEKCSQHPTNDSSCANADDKE